ncbi:Ribonuclease H-like domain [Phytophthora cinnamomi]|uniref:Ribonuclease H-like domain n=1 Tax=Phytophthora cinnamomi TaxID=4785 RepID=UPI003559DF46|nr:Ribonuclease H-like domain [Phytophthora cinnamomi]
MDAAPATLKRTGRPVHPLWAHFHRGEKRNRYHYHAYCSYCVARHGAEQVPPTRGVSSDMLRHLESCPNCPRKVVETVKELCGRRERSAHNRKSASNGDDESSRRLEEAVNDDDDDQVLLLDAVAAAASATAASVAAMQEARQQTTADDAAAVLAAAAGTEAVAVDTAVSAKRTASEALADEAVDMPRLTHVDTTACSGGEDKRLTPKTSGGYLTMPAKRGRTDSGNAAEQEHALARWRVSVLQTAVAAGIPLSAFQKSEFQELLQVLSPGSVDSDEVISSVGSQAFLEETAAKLAQSQLERVKEGMLNSTIKSGLTLSITSWRTLDLQYLVAFTLVNSNGDAACVRVEDLEGRITSHGSTDEHNDSSSPMTLLHPAKLLPLADAIEDVLQELNDKNICVMGVVADSAVGLSAAKRVCRSESLSSWRRIFPMHGCWHHCAPFPVKMMLEFRFQQKNTGIRL